MSKFTRVLRLGTLPETRRVLAAAARPATLRDVGRRAVNDRAGLLRDAREHAHPRAVLRGVAGHPAARELAQASFLFLPARYTPLGWVTSWATLRVLRRYAAPPAERRTHQPPGRPTDRGVRRIKS